MRTTKAFDPTAFRGKLLPQFHKPKRKKGILTGTELARRTGYSRERIRQLTYPTTSSNGPGTLLVPFIEKVIETNLKKHYIYKPEAVEFLQKRKAEYGA